MTKPFRYYCALVVLLALSPSFAYQTFRESNSRELPTGDNVLWTDPGDVLSLDFNYGIGGAERQPEPPFRFIREDLSGTIPKVNVTDNRGTTWNVKFGPEAHASVFCTRLLWACGYFAQTEYFVAEGQIEGIHDLKRAGSQIRDDGSFRNARFQLRSHIPKYLDGYSWTWTSNPFSGTPELQGLKILMLLVSNWDTKDARDFVESKGIKRMDSNLAIFEDTGSGQSRYLFADIDWGASMGMWGNALSWSKWDCRGFSQQTSIFVKGVKDNRLRWGFRGKHRTDMVEDITTDDVRWMMQYLGKISDAQIQDALAASGATRREIDCYGRALRDRIEQLRQVVDELSQ